MNFFKSKILNTYFPLLIGFMLGKLISQTDLLMLARLGNDAVAAFAVPSRIMIFDMIVAFSLAPVVSVFVASEKNQKNKVNIIKNCISTSLIIGIILMLIGLVFYPAINKFIIVDKNIQSLSHSAIVLMTFAIPTRLTQFVLTMILHSLSSGKKIILIDSIILALNFALNYILMFYFEVGFVGCYISTFFCSLVSFAWMYFYLKSKLEVNSLLVIPQKSWLKEFLSKSSAEWLRLGLFQMVGVLTLYLINHVGSSESTLVAFSASAELHHFILIPMIAFMRAIGISSSGSSYETLTGRVTELSSVLRNGALLLIPISIVLFWTAPFIGEKVYSLPKNSIESWNSYIYFVSGSLVLFYLNSVYRGVFQSLKLFSTLTKIEFVTKWIVYLPLVFFGLKTDNATLTWGSILAMEACEFFCLFFIVKYSRTDPHRSQIQQG